MTSRLAGMVAGVAIVALCGCASPPPQATRASTPVATVSAADAETPALVLPAYRVNPGDEVEVRFFSRPELNTAVRVRSDGKLSLPLIGAMDVAGLSTEALEIAISERYRALSADEIAAKDKQYLIGPDDEIEIRFAYVQSLDQTVRVRPDGKIALNLVQTVEAQGRTPEQLREELVSRYRQHLRNPELVVVMKSFSRSRVYSNGRQMLSGLDDLRPVVLVKGVQPAQVYVGGEVNRGGAMPFQPPVTLLQAIMQAGGIRPTAEMRSVIVLRKGPSGEALVIRRNLKADLEGTSTNDIYLAPYDVVVVPKTAVAATAEAIDQYVWQVLPPLRNTYFGFIYQLGGSVTTTIKTNP